MEAGKISYQNYTSRAMNNRTKKSQESHHQQNQESYHQQNQEYSKLARYSSMNEIKGLESNTQSNLIQTKHQSQTEGLLTSHSSDLQLLTLNIDHYPIQRVQTITHIIVYFVPQPTIIAIIVYTIRIEYILYSKQCNKALHLGLINQKTCLQLGARLD